MEFFFFFFWIGLSVFIKENQDYKGFKNVWSQLLAYECLFFGEKYGLFVPKGKIPI